MARGRRAARGARAGFTLIELLAVLLLTSIVLGIALDFYLDLSRASKRATESTRDLRRAVAILDRIGRDLEGAVLAVKPPELDPLSHPWIFLAESAYAEQGSDQLKFVTRSHIPRRSEAAESDLAMVSYTVGRDENENLALRRWSSPRLPEGLDRDFPSDEESFLIADGLESFRFRFMAEDGSWVDSWDSSLLIDSGELPVAVEIEIAMASPADLDSTLASEDPRVYRKTVVLPMRPLDLAMLTDPAAVPGGAGPGGEEGDGGPGSGTDEDNPFATGGGGGGGADATPYKPGKTVRECVVMANIPQHLHYFYEANPGKKIIDLPPGWFEPGQIRAECVR